MPKIIDDELNKKKYHEQGWDKYWPYEDRPIWLWNLSRDDANEN